MKMTPKNLTPSSVLSGLSAAELLAVIADFQQKLALKEEVIRTLDHSLKSKEQVLQSKEDAIQRRDAHILLLEELLRLRRIQRFAASSEKLHQLQLFDEAELEADMDALLAQLPDPWSNLLENHNIGGPVAAPLQHCRHASSRPRVPAEPAGPAPLCLSLGRRDQPRRNRAAAPLARHKQRIVRGHQHGRIEQVRTDNRRAVANHLVAIERSQREQRTSIVQGPVARHIRRQLKVEPGFSPVVRQQRANGVDPVGRVDKAELHAGSVKPACRITRTRQASGL